MISLSISCKERTPASNKSFQFLFILGYVYFNLHFWNTPLLDLGFCFVLLTGFLFCFEGLCGILPPLASNISSEKLAVVLLGLGLPCQWRIIFLLWFSRLFCVWLLSFLLWCVCWWALLSRCVGYWFSVTLGSIQSFFSFLIFFLYCFCHCCCCFYLSLFFLYSLYISDVILNGIPNFYEILFIFLLFFFLFFFLSSVYIISTDLSSSWLILSFASSYLLLRSSSVFNFYYCTFQLQNWHLVLS